jgi:hypothetical protein
MKRGLLCVCLVFLSLMAGCIILPIPLPAVGESTPPVATPDASATPTAAQSATPVPVATPTP